MVFISNQQSGSNSAKKTHYMYRVLVFVRFLIYKKSYKLMSIAQAPTIY